MPQKKNKPSLFIGSASEGYYVAEAASKYLSDVCECHLWKDEFELGNAAYEDLVKLLSLHDYGLLIGTADDFTISRKSKRPSARDNVLLEFGLFVGRLGRSRSFLMVEDGIKVPSDLSGITLPFIPLALKKGPAQKVRASRREQLKVVKKRCEKIGEDIKKRERVFDFGYLPSTALAYGYYTNFVHKLVSQLFEKKTLSVVDANGTVTKTVQFKDLQLTILLPDDLRADMFDQVKAHRQKSGWSLIKVAPEGFRPFDFYAQLNKSTPQRIFLSDIPITLNALNQAIGAYIGKSYIGVSEAEALLECRELRAFRKVLEELITSNPITKGRVVVEIVKI